MNQTTTALIEHLSHVAEEIAKLKSELQTEKRDWELTNELLKDRIDELQIQAQDKDKEIWKIKQDARDEIFQEREKVVADYMEIIIKKDEEIARLKEAVKNNAKVVVEASAAEIIVIKGLQLRNKELEEELKTIKSTTTYEIVKSLGKNNRKLENKIEVLKNSNEQLKSWVKDHPKIKELEDKLLKKSQEVANIHQKYYELKKKVLAKAITGDNKLFDEVMDYPKEIYGKSPAIEKYLKIEIFKNELVRKRIKQLEREKDKNSKERKK